MPKCICGTELFFNREMYYLDNDELCPTQQFAFDGAMSILNLLNFVSRKHVWKIGGVMKKLLLKLSEVY